MQKLDSIFGNIKISLGKDLICKYVNMATEKQRSAAKRNIKKAQERWKSMTKRERALAQPNGRKRRKPGTTGLGKYFRVVLRRKEQFTSFKVHDVGEKGGLQRVAGRRSSGSWDTQAWLISKDIAKREGTTIVGTSKSSKDLLEKLGSKPKFLKGDIYTAKDVPNVPESEKPTLKQKLAWKKNIAKAQRAKRKK